jgi:hypothetical protein
VSHWSLYNLGSRHGHSPHLEAVLAHELAHHLTMPWLVWGVVLSASASQSGSGCGGLVWVAR